MNRSRLVIALFALAVCTTAGAAAPHYALIDLGPSDIAGAGLLWEPLSSTFAPSDWPSIAGGPLGPENGIIYARYGTIAVGASPAPNHETNAAEWTLPANGVGPITVTDFGVLPGALPGNTRRISIAIGFNTVGDVVGFSNSAYASATGSGAAAIHAFLYERGQMIDLGSLAGPEYNSSAHGLNDSHEIVGSTDAISPTTGAVRQRAFVYVSGTMYDLTSRIEGKSTVVLSDALWIDRHGNIAAVGTPAPGGNTHDYLLVEKQGARSRTGQK